MSWRTVIISSRCKLDTKMGYMVIRGEEVKRIFLDEIAVLLIENPAVAMTGCLLNTYIEQMEFADTTNREGHAAKVYFNALFGMDFSRSSPEPVNAALNYGYSILLAAFSWEIVSCGYVTQLGLHHENVFNRFNLASDLRMYN